MNNQYYVHYLAADGRGVDGWFDEGELSPAKPIKQRNKIRNKNKNNRKSANPPLNVLAPTVFDENYFNDIKEKMLALLMK